jgi:hypothetical protein
MKLTNRSFATLLSIALLFVFGCGGVSNPREVEELRKELAAVKNQLATNNGKNQPYCSGVLEISTDVQQSPDWSVGKCTNPTMGTAPGDYEFNGFIAKVTDIPANDPKNPTICGALIVPAQGGSSFKFPGAGKQVDLTKTDADASKPCEVLTPTRPAAK